MDVAWIALIGTIVGGAGLKIVESLLGRSSKKIDTATGMREELRKDLAASKDEARLLEHELDQWKEKYFLLLQEHLDVKSQLAHRPVQPEDKGGDW